ncbi:SDR family NAD(P)-dependent oxidoreductase [Kineococcus indalonis]|uniref:SDR family NAD(P)-dependent oxidoreductase n=1 Tax=Kineococcus indalonis TaxID=2696566 RepID=UPI002B1BDAFE|nr:SDR family NAD(P)-dependent oxidoreductase [Kineococcus indalonis]
MSTPLGRPTALITGATAGLGASYAAHLAAAGHDLVIVARDGARLEETAERLRERHGVQVEVLAADLAQREQLAVVAARLGDAARPVDLLVNNAGYGLKQSLAVGQIELLEQHFDVLARAVLVLCNAAAKAMVARGRGRILNVGSIAALLAGGGHYAALKGYVLALTESLAKDLRGSGVSATVVLPGYVHTEFHVRAGMKGASGPSRAWLNADDVVTDSLRDTFAGRLVSVPSPQYRALAALLGVLPRSAVRAAWRLGSRKAPSNARTTSPATSPATSSPAPTARG